MVLNDYSRIIVSICVKIMNITEIKEKINYGDFNAVAKVVGISKDNARNAFLREKSKHHSAVREALIKIITHRENLIKKA